MFGVRRSLHQTQRIYYVTISTMKPQCEKNNAPTNYTNLLERNLGSILSKATVHLTSLGKREICAATSRKKSKNVTTHQYIPNSRLHINEIFDFFSI